VKECHGIFKIVSQITPQWMLMALAGDVAGPCAGKNVRFENRLNKDPKIVVRVQQPTLHIFAQFVRLSCLGFQEQGRRR